MRVNRLTCLRRRDQSIVVSVAYRKNTAEQTLRGTQRHTDLPADGALSAQRQK
jgi:hypothetical protein